MKIIFSKEFEKDTKHIKDKLMRIQIDKAIKKIIGNPVSGKPLSYELAGLRSARLSHFRIIYEINQDTI